MFDTIAAVSTPRGVGAIAVVRVSGEEAHAVAERVLGASKPLKEYGAGRLFRCAVRRKERVVDDAMAVLFASPRSYTGEDMVEIYCHGGAAVTEAVLTALLEAGARGAEAGEFTRRAFLHGKLTLDEAEAVGDLLGAQTEEGATLAASNLRGALRRRTDRLSEVLTRAIAAIMVDIDFPEEGESTFDRGEMLSSLRKLEGELAALADGFQYGRATLEGVKTVLCGRPNVGKSSLFNRLCRHEAAIVTAHAGTTRDALHETVRAGRMLLQLWDTAGIRQTRDEVESLGVDRSLEKIGEAELILAVFDASVPLTEEDRRVIRAVKGRPCIAVANKTDLGTVALEELKTSFCQVCPLCAQQGEGMEALLAMMEENYVPAGRADSGVLTNVRQYTAVTNALACVQRACNLLEAGMEADMVSVELEDGLRALTGLGGTGVSERVVGEIFANFCVGK